MVTLRSVSVSPGNDLKLNLMYMLEKELTFLYELCANAPPGPVVELGCGYGAATCTFASTGRKVYSVDVIFNDNKAGTGDVDIYRETIKPFKHLITEVPGDSGEQGLKWGRGKIAVLFIDGNHRYEPVKKDIEVWTPHLMKGGIIAFHDYAFNSLSPDTGWKPDPHPGVIKAVDMFFPFNPEYTEEGWQYTIKAFRKV